MREQRDPNIKWRHLSFDFIWRHLTSFDVIWRHRLKSCSRRFYCTTNPSAVTDVTRRRIFLEWRQHASATPLHTHQHPSKSESMMTSLKKWTCLHEGMQRPLRRDAPPSVRPVPAQERCSTEKGEGGKEKTRSYPANSVILVEWYYDILSVPRAVPRESLASSASQTN